MRCTTGSVTLSSRPPQIDSNVFAAHISDPGNVKPEISSTAAATEAKSISSQQGPWVIRKWLPRNPTQCFSPAACACSARCARSVRCALCLLCSLCPLCSLCSLCSLWLFVPVVAAAVVKYFRWSQVSVEIYPRDCESGLFEPGVVRFFY